MAVTAGFETYRSDGALQASSNMYTFNLRKTGTATTATRGQTTVGSSFGNTEPSDLLIPAFGSADALCAVQCAGYATALHGFNPSYGWMFITNAPPGTVVNYYIYDKISVLSPSAHLAGIECYDASGKVTFSTAYWPMSAISMLSHNSTLINNGDPWEGKAYFNDPSSVQFTGKSLATMQGAPAGHQYHGGMMTCYLNGRAVIGSTCDYWTYRNDGKLYGGTVSSDKTTITTAEVSWDDVTITTYDGTKPPDWEIPLKLFVVDVTNVPIGKTFF